MLRRDISKLLLAGSATAAAAAAPQLAQAQTCSTCYPVIPAETALGITPDTRYAPGDVRRYGAQPDNNPGSALTNYTAFLTACKVALRTATDTGANTPNKIPGVPQPVIFPAGSYYYGTANTPSSINWAIPGITLQAIGRVQLNYIGSGNAWIFDANTSPDPALNPHDPTLYGDVYNCRMLGDFVINGNPGATNGLFIQGVHQSKFEARVANVTQAGCDINFCVGTSFRVQTTVYALNRVFTTTPIRGYYIKGRGTGEYTAWCEFHDTYIDSCSGFGIDIVYARGCAFFGGTVEYCGGGIRIDQTSFCQHNSFYNVDMEQNTTSDAVIYGQNNRLVSCTAQSGFPLHTGNYNLIVGAQAYGTTIIGGYLKNCMLQSSSDQTVFLNTSFHVGGAPVGAGAYRAMGCYTVNEQISPPDAPNLFVAYVPDVLGPNIQLPNLPTAPTGLPAGSLWNSGGTLKIV